MLMRYCCEEFLFYSRGSNGKLSLRFPTYGSKKDSYVIPENKEVYMQMLRVIRMAVKEPNFHTAEIQGATDLSFIVCAESAADAAGNLWFDLHIKDLCVFKGISIQQTNSGAVDRICISLPSLPFSEHPHEHYRAVFQGLPTEHAVKINQAPCMDCASLIKDLVLREYNEVYLSQQQS